MPLLLLLTTPKIQEQYNLQIPYLSNKTKHAYTYAGRDRKKRFQEMPVQVLLDQNSICDLEWIAAEKVHNVQRKKDQEGSLKIKYKSGLP